MDLKSTLNLPDANFTIPMKADLATREPEIQTQWDALGIYHLIREYRKDAPTFVLHDGPPYTNGMIHIGHALNKCLKDFVVKSRSMMGFLCPFVPGYDNHGLPIEQAVMKTFQDRKESPDISTLRKACRDHARFYIGTQTSQFKRLGVFGLWEEPYVTMDFRYEAEIVRTFKRLVEKDQVYRGLRPVLWSPTSRTALADTEIVYQEHTSKAIFVRFRLNSDPNHLFSSEELMRFENVYAIIWTTTPWTIPANVGLAFHPDYSYALVEHDGSLYLVLDELAGSVMEACGLAGYNQIGLIRGDSLVGTTFKHPLFERNSAAVTADYVTTEDGTGIVHTAPGHGREDFITGMKNGLPILCPVDGNGVMTKEAGEFEGLYYTKCNEAVIQRLQEVGALLDVRDHQHSYPHAERDGKPVIFRTTEQWFVSIDENGLREKMLGEIENVEWIPDAGRARITAMVTNRPDWCISRQRPWGVGIPVFYGKESRQPVLDLDVIERIAQLIEREGSDAWFVRPASEILPDGYVHPETNENEFEKETDVFDVWFDSGATNLCVLEGNVQPLWKSPWPAELYLEGSDQHRGWFNQSLVIATAIKGGAPYKSVVTHGFVVDESGLKMSKRLGNVVDPQDVCDRYGADILRYWVASVDYANDVPCSENILKQFGESYRRVRNTLRFLLSNLSDYDGQRPQTLMDVDQWAIEQVDLLVSDAVSAYERYDFGAVINGVHNFCVQQLSSFYLDAIKDRIYCDGRDWESRRSSQAACHYVLLKLVRLIAPILCHTAEEVYAKIPAIEVLPSVHCELFEAPSPERLSEIQDNDLQERFAKLLAYRAVIFAQFESWKLASDVKDSQDVVVSLTDSEENLAVLYTFEKADLANYLKMSWVEMEEGEPMVAFRVSEYLKCDRSRIRRPDVSMVDGVALSARDRKVLGL